MAQVIYVASLTRCAIDLPSMAGLPYIAGNMTGIADTMHNSSEMSQVIFTQRHSHNTLLTRRAVDLPYTVYGSLHDRHR